jgi:hypothetical protein
MPMILNSSLLSVIAAIIVIVLVTMSFTFLYRIVYISTSTIGNRIFVIYDHFLEYDIFFEELRTIQLQSSPILIISTTTSLA